MNQMNQMAGAMFNLWIISMFFYHQMNRMNRMIDDYFFFFCFLSPDEPYKTDCWRNDYLVHLVHLVMINSIQQWRYEYLAVGLIVFVAFAG